MFGEADRLAVFSVFLGLLSGLQLPGSAPFLLALLVHRTSACPSILSWKVRSPRTKLEISESIAKVLGS